MRSAVSVFVFMLLILPVSAFSQEEAGQPVDPAAVQAAGKILQGEAQQLLKEIMALRAAELEKMRQKSLKDMDDWQSGLTDLDGQGLKAALANAYAVAEGYGMDVPRLQKLYEATKRVIRRLEFAALCGKDKGFKGQIGDSLKDTAVLGDVVHFYGMVNEEEQRISCAMEHKRRLYKDTARAFIRALTVKDPAEAARSFREYADNIRNISQADAMALTAEADQLAAEQNLVVRNVELIPLVGDAMDILSASTGEDLAGNKLSKTEQSFILLSILTPEAFEQFGKRFPDALPAMGKFLKKVVMPENGFVDHLADTGSVLWFKAKTAAVDLLEAMGETKFVQQAAKSTRSVAELAARAQAKAIKASDEIKRGLGSLPGIGSSRAKAVKQSNMPDVWVDAMSKTAQERGEIILIRPVNKHSRKWLESGEAIGKSMNVKGKTSDWGPMAGLIPADQSLSKLGKPSVVNARIDEMSESIKAKILKDSRDAGQEITEAEAQRQARELARQRVDLDISKSNKSIKESLAHPNVKAVPLKKDGMDVVKVVDGEGNVAVVMKKKDGSFVTEKGRSYTPPKDADISQVEVLADKHTGKYLAADADMLGVGTPRAQGNIRQGATFDHAGHGGISDAETGTMFGVNVKTRSEGLGGNVINHGPATRYHDPPDYPVTMFLPDKKGTVVVIESEADLKKVFRTAKQNGMSGLEPHPKWGWGDNWDKEVD